jgi:alpha-tubulin suppressor-like RCC1 family protein
MWSWGNGGYGSLGHNDQISRSSPTQIGALTTWSRASSGYSSAAVKTDGTLWAWGNNATGRLGDGTTIRRSSPVQIGSGTDWVDVACGAHSMYLEKIVYRTGMS